MAKAKKKAKRKSARSKFSRLSASEQKTIRSMTKASATMRQIAKKIGRAPSTIWRWQQEI